MWRVNHPPAPPKNRRGGVVCPYFCYHPGYCVIGARGYTNTRKIYLPLAPLTTGADFGQSVCALANPGLSNKPVCSKSRFLWGNRHSRCKNPIKTCFSFIHCPHRNISEITSASLSRPYRAICVKF